MADTATWDVVIVAPHPVAYHRVINRALRLSRRGLTGKKSVGTNPCAVPRTRARFYEAGFTAVNQIEKHGTHKSGSLMIWLRQRIRCCPPLPQMMHLSIRDSAETVSEELAKSGRPPDTISFWM
jgi:hypothetical protein